MGPHLSEAVVVEINKDLPVRAGDRIYELSATGVGQTRLKQEAKTPATDDALKELERAFEKGTLKPPTNP